MHFGTYMGIYWILKFILFPLGFHIPFLSLLFVILTLAVPFIGYHYVKMYRDKICGGSIQFSHAVLFTIFMYMFASLLVAVVHYIYFQFIDHGFIVNSYIQLWDELMTNTPALAENKDIIKETIRIRQNGKLIPSVMDLLLDNTRVPQEREGDLTAQMSANLIGVQRIQEAYARYQDDLIECMKELVGYSERRVRAVVAELPDGEYSYTDYVQS